ncbi:MAG: hypothetical protein AAGF11_52880, partial [Myxococcota bacterium]
MTDLRRFADLASPSFFEVVPMRSLWSQGRALLASTRDPTGFSELLGRVSDVLGRLGVPVVIGTEDESCAEQATTDPHQRGQWVLQLYFAQLAQLGQAALDLRPARFHARRDRQGTAMMTWSPRPLAVAWDPAFIAGVRGLYSGFYRDDEALFERSADALGLSMATDLFRQQFGTGDQTAVRFELDRFKESFHQIFVRCREHGVALHPNFVALGIYLGGLYEHLDP